MSRESRRLAREARERDRQEQERRQQRQEEAKQSFQREMARCWQEVTSDLGILFPSEGYRIAISFDPKSGEVVLKTDAEILAQLTTLASGREWRPEWRLTADPEAE